MCPLRWKILLLALSGALIESQISLNMTKNWDRGYGGVEDEVNSFAVAKGAVAAGGHIPAHEMISIHVRPKPRSVALAHPREGHHGCILGGQRLWTKQVVCFGSWKWFGSCCTYAYNRCIQGALY
jgi:hypothetical protein